MAEAVMLDLRDTYPHRALDLMIERTKWQKYCSAFFSAYAEQVDENDRIHTTFKLTGTVTGRLSSGKADQDKVTSRKQNRGVNLQQVPRDDFVRGIFGAPPGSSFVEADYSQIELRVAAFIARETTMLHLYATGQDIHMATAMMMTGKPAHAVTKEERKKAKAVNFGFLYGMGWSKFIATAWANYGVRVTEQESRAFRTAFFEQFPRLLQWHARQRQLVTKYKRVESPLGRVRHLPDIDSPNKEVRAEAERQAINSPVQSFASDMALLSLVHITHEFERRGLRAHAIGTVHDAINFEIPDDELRIALPIIKDRMENLPLERMFGLSLDVPIVADLKVGSRWGGATEITPEQVYDWRGLAA
jgi:DNA polymerase-1